MEPFFPPSFRHDQPPPPNFFFSGRSSAEVWRVVRFFFFSPDARGVDVSRIFFIGELRPAWLPFFPGSKDRPLFPPPPPFIWGGREIDSFFFFTDRARGQISLLVLYEGVQAACFFFPPSRYENGSSCDSSFFLLLPWR